MFTLASPAKINLFLRIIKRKEDGYHELASLFQTVTLFDTIRFDFSDQDLLTCSDSRLPCDERNLIHKALHLYRLHLGPIPPLHIHLEKRIPVEAGLGGGSSNAATTLWALNRIAAKPVSIDALKGVAKQIGADVSFFLSNGTAYCTGIGDIVQPAAPLPDRDLWLVKPAWGLSTPKVYKMLDASSLPQRNPEQSLKSFIEGDGEFYNDLEGPAFRLSAETRDLKRRLEACGFSTVLMSGSGSSFFCLGNAIPPADPGLTCFPVRFVNRSIDDWYSL